MVVYSSVHLDRMSRRDRILCDLEIEFSILGGGSGDSPCLGRLKQVKIDSLSSSWSSS